MKRAEQMKTRTRVRPVSGNTSRSNRLREGLLIACFAALLSFAGGWALNEVTADRARELVNLQEIAERNDRLLQSLAPNVTLKLGKTTWGKDRIQVEMALTNAGDWVVNSRVSANAEIFGDGVPSNEQWTVEVCAAGYVQPGATIACPITFKTMQSFDKVRRLKFNYKVDNEAYKPDESAILRVLKGEFTEDQIRSRLRTNIWMIDEVDRS